MAAFNSAGLLSYTQEASSPPPEPAIGTITYKNNTVLSADAAWCCVRQIESRNGQIISTEVDEADQSCGLINWVSTGPSATWWEREVGKKLSNAVGMRLTHSTQGQQYFSRSSRKQIVTSALAVSYLSLTCIWIGHAWQLCLDLWGIKTMKWRCSLESYKDRSCCAISISE